MCACGGTGIITNDMGIGMYQKFPCSCAEGEQSREEHMKNRQEWLKHFNALYDAWKGGQEHGDSAATRVHEGIPA